MNLKLLASKIYKIGDERQLEKPHPSDIVVHLRLGDIREPGHPIGPERIFKYYSSFFQN